MNCFPVKVKSPDTLGTESLVKYGGSTSFKNPSYVAASHIL